MITENGCVIGWPGRKNRDGYPIARIHKYSTVARIMYELFKGPIPEGLCVRHTCDNRECVNPEHLIVGTHQDNMSDKKARGRQPRGEDSPATRYSDAVVMAIRTGDYSVHEARVTWGIKKAQYYRIRNGESRA